MVLFENAWNFSISKNVIFYLFRVLLFTIFHDIDIVLCEEKNIKINLPGLKHIITVDTIYKIILPVLYYYEGRGSIQYSFFLLFENKTSTSILQ